MKQSERIAVQPVGPESNTFVCHFKRAACLVANEKDGGMVCLRMLDDVQQKLASRVEEKIALIGLFGIRLGFSLHSHLEIVNAVHQRSQPIERLRQSFVMQKGRHSSTDRVRVISTASFSSTTTSFKSCGLAAAEGGVAERLDAEPGGDQGLLDMIVKNVGDSSALHLFGARQLSC